MVGSCGTRKSVSLCDPPSPCVQKKPNRFSQFVILCLTTEIASRYVEFDIDALKDIACKAVGAERCTKFIVHAEGMYVYQHSLRSLTEQILIE